MYASAGAPRQAGRRRGGSPKKDALVGARWLGQTSIAAGSAASALLASRGWAWAPGTWRRGTWRTSTGRSRSCRCGRGHRQIGQRPQQGRRSAGHGVRLGAECTGQARAPASRAESPGRRSMVVVEELEVCLDDGLRGAGHGPVARSYGRTQQFRKHCVARSCVGECRSARLHLHRQVSW